ncbi:putative steroid binding protein [Schizothecium vesticola]|uniref:5-hydroxyisourate hydrolase n=1 Tax=Schizothecium vesticola TaxID=314040 RepID=A0AA40FB81_9PEZI|nr:putative steroid binding protein [Schizothecium vesticola]
MSPPTETETKDRITCHVLDTRQGLPARGMRVKLELSSPKSTAGARIFESQTDDDGRIKVWLPYSSETSSGEVPVYTLDDVLDGVEVSDADAATSRWTLRFDTEGYFGGADKTFFPEVTVVFGVARGERYHVPVLLAPFSYTTYRGS